MVAVPGAQGRAPQAEADTAARRGARAGAGRRGASRGGGACLRGAVPGGEGRAGAGPGGEGRARGGASSATLKGRWRRPSSVQGRWGRSAPWPRFPPERPVSLPGAGAGPLSSGCAPACDGGAGSAARPPPGPGLPAAALRRGEASGQSGPPRPSAAGAPAEVSSVCPCD